MKSQTALNLTASVLAAIAFTTAPTLRASAETLPQAQSPQAQQPTNQQARNHPLPWLALTHAKDAGHAQKGYVA